MQKVSIYKVLQTIATDSQNSCEQGYEQGVEK